MVHMGVSALSEGSERCVVDTESTSVTRPIGMTGPRVLKTVVMALVMTATGPGQSTQSVALDNGSIFEGTVVIETDRFLD